MRTRFWSAFSLSLCLGRWRPVLLALTLALLSSCSDQPSPAPAPLATSPSASETTADATPDRFAVAAITGESSGGRPALTVRFTRPLADAHARIKRRQQQVRDQHANHSQKRRKKKDEPRQELVL